MKRTFLTRRNALLTPGSFSTGSIVLSMVLVSALVRVVAPTLFFSVTTPFFRAGAWVSHLGEVALATVADRVALERANNDLRSQNALLQAENQALHTKSDELARLLGVPSQKGEASLTASVLARPPESPYDTLLIDAGSREGVTERMSALVGASVGSGIPIGVITDVGEHVARITLFTAPLVATPAWVGTDKTPVTLVGAGGGALTSTVARGSKVSAGDRVMVGGGTLIGYVAALHENPSSPVISLSIQLLVNPFSITHVLLRHGAETLLREPVAP